MDVNRLRSDELSYELIIRNVDPGTTVLDKRSQLRHALRENYTVLSNLPTPLCDTDHELQVIASKLDELGEEIIEFNTENKENDMARIHTRLTHAQRRLYRISPNSRITQTKWSNLETIVKEQLEALNDAYKIANLRMGDINSTTHSASILDTPNPPILDTPTHPTDFIRTSSTITYREPPTANLVDTGPEPVISQRHLVPIQNNPMYFGYENSANKWTDPTSNFAGVNPNLSSSSRGIPRRVSFDVNQPLITTLPPSPTASAVGNNGLARPQFNSTINKIEDTSHQVIHLYKWNLQFDGKGSVTSFLERVEELRESRGISKGQLFRSAVELFRGDALTWYRPRRSHLKDWDDLCTQLKSSFLPPGYETRLLQEIQKRTQGAEEKLILYVSVMENLFNKLTNRPCERDRVQTIRGNLLPRIQRGLAALKIENTEDLLQYGRAVEETEFLSQQYCPPPTSSRSMVEPELAYYPSTHGKPEKLHALTPLPAPRLSYSQEIKCWNCGEIGHHRTTCDKPTKILCFRCGKAGFTVRSCPKCSGNGNQGPLKSRWSGSGKNFPVGFDSLIPKQQAILEFLLEGSSEDERPHLYLTVYGHRILGLLDSGASRTVLGGSGWSLLKNVCRLDTSKSQQCYVANGVMCNGIGTVLLPLALRDKVKLMEVLVVPEIKQPLILGIDFWKLMGIVPNLRSGDWTFTREQTTFCISATESREHLNEDQRRELEHLIQTAFTATNDKLGFTHLISHEIKTDSVPIKQRYYPISPILQKHVDSELDKLLANDIAEPSTSAWSSPIILVKKKDDTYRFCVDYRRLNSVSLPDAYPLPQVSSILDKLRNAKYLTTLDIKSAYWQIPMAESSRPYTAFTVPNRGLFQFKRMPFGLHNAPATWSRLIDRVIGVDLEPYVFAYLDDIICVTPTFEKHIEVLTKIFERLKNANLTLSRDKCHFCKPELRYLGYLVSAQGLSVDPDKVAAVTRIPPPTNAKEVRRFLGMCSWYRRFVPDFSTKIAPLTELLQKNRPYLWTRKCHHAFNELKESLISSPVLACPDWSLPFVVQTDASEYGLGAVLTQQFPEGERAICFLSRSLSRTERKYSVTEKECLGVIHAIEKLRPYLEGAKFKVITDHYSLKWLNSIKDPIGRIARWAVRMQQYNFEVEHRKGKHNIVPDALSRAVPAFDAIQTNPGDKWYQKMVQRVVNDPLEFALWRVSNGKLYRLARCDHSSLDSRSERWKEVAPKQNRADILRQCHDSPTSGHMGVYKTFHRVAQRYYWPKMRSDVASFVRRCRVCAATKPEQKPPVGTMGSHSPIAVPWEVISIDIVGPLPRSTRGYNYILVVMDCFSKFVLFFPLRSATAPRIVQHVEEDVILMFGAPRTIICDNGVQFRSRQFRELADKYGSMIKFTANYHPQANPTERVNRVLKTILTAYVNEKHQEWDKYLATAACAIRTAKHEVTGHTPYLVNFGNEMIVDRQADEGDISLSSHPQRDILLRSTAFKKLYRDIQTRLSKAYEKSKQRYDLRRRTVSYAVGQEVYRRNYTLSDASKHYTAKLAPKFIGPFIIGKKLSPWIFQLKDPDGKICGTWHAKDLKPYYIGANENVTDEET
jgi:transposase InsO family protein